MAAKLDKEMLKKQHFWLLLIPVVIGLLLAWIGLFVGVSSATEEKEAANKAAEQEIQKATAQSREVLKLYDKRKDDLFKLRTQRHKEMWDLQQSVFEWPKSLGEDQVAKVKDMKFGAEISDSSFLNTFRDHYAKEYETLATDVAPMQFAGGWYTVLRHIPKWTRTPESEDVWLAAEDFWVEREIVRSLAQVNIDAAKLTARTPPEAGLRKRTFANRTWELTLQLTDKPNGVAIEGTIKNLTPRLQPFNVNNELVFNVWLNDDPSTKPFQYVVEGASLEGGKTEPIKFIEKRHIVFEGNPRGLYRVEQEFDVRTAPVKRLDKLAIGTQLALSARHSEAELQMSAFSEKGAKADQEAAGSAGGGGPGGGGPGGGGPGPRGATGGMGLSMPSPAPGGMGGTNQQASGDSTYNGLARRRYISRTDQVRAMPIGLTVIADQAYVQDVLTAVANCKLRFQTVQTLFARFRGSLLYSSGAAGSGFGEAGPGMPGAGIPGGPSMPGGSPLMPIGPATGAGGGATGDGRGAGPPSGPRPSGGGMGPSFPGIPGLPSFPGFPGGSFPGYPSGSSPRSSNEDQVATNLVEVTMYGITAIYEKFEAPAGKDNKADGDTEPAKTEPAKTDPKAGPGNPKGPAGTPTTPAPMKDMPPAPMKDMPPTAPTDPAKK
jgi:hypothetical protein